MNCYAAREALRHSNPGGAYEGLVRITTNGPRWTGKVQFIQEHLLDPIHWRRPRRIFVNSMSDLFHENLADCVVEWIFGVMALCGRHKFQVLTKRPENMKNFLSSVGYESRSELFVHSLFNQYGPEPTCDANWTMPLSNVWLGVSVENQETADKRIPILLQTPAAVRWVSYEPALGPVSFWPWLSKHAPVKLDWGVCGGESGPHARPMDVAWARLARDQFQAAGVPFLMKQMGGVVDKRNDLLDLPEDLRVREYPR